MNGARFSQFTGMAVCAIVVLGVEAQPAIACFLGVLCGALATGGMEALRLRRSRD